MTIVPFRTEDIASFMALAAAEGWVTDMWEFKFLLAGFARGCFSACGDNGEVEGFVTALRHERSGWIGNLIVASQFRGRGVGEALFRKAVDALRQAGVQTIWLTASKVGMPLYEKHGFHGIDTIIRWVGTGQQRHEQHYKKTGHDVLAPVAHDVDARAWGDRRGRLLAAAAARGMIFQDEAGFIVRQTCGQAVQFGPFSAKDPGNAERLFRDAAGTVSSGIKVVLDAPASNRGALRLFKRRKMQIVGSNVLMYAGVKPEYRPELLYGLATMGSCG